MSGPKIPGVRFDNSGDLIAGWTGTKGIAGSTRKFAQGAGSIAATEAGKQAMNAQIDPNVDAITREEILSLYNQGDGKQIFSLLEKAKEGKGIYAIRKVMNNQRRIETDMPGRRQLMSNTGTSLV